MPDFGTILDLLTYGLWPMPLLRNEHCNLCAPQAELSGPSSGFLLFWDALLNLHKGADLIPPCAVATQPMLQMSRLRPFLGGSSELASSNVCIKKEAARWWSSCSEWEAGPDDLQRSLTNNIFMILWFCFLSITQNICTVRSVTKSLTTAT